VISQAWRALLWIVRRHARTEKLCLLISMVLRLGYMSMCPKGKYSYVYRSSGLV
jgi:hypothetical protein